MPWKFYFAKTAGMKANFTGFKRNLLSPYLFWIVFISNLPLTPMSIYISAVFTESFQKRDFKISFYIWDMSLACNFITTGNEDRFWALVTEFTLSPALLRKIQQYQQPAVPCIREMLNFYLHLFLSNKGNALSTLAVCSVMTTCYRSCSAEIFHYYKDVSTTVNVWVGATHAFQPCLCLAESIAACCARETLCKEHWNRGVFSVGTLRNADLHSCF